MNALLGLDEHTRFRTVSLLTALLMLTGCMRTYRYDQFPDPHPQPVFGSYFVVSACHSPLNGNTDLRAGPIAVCIDSRETPPSELTIDLAQSWIRLRDDAPQRFVELRPRDNAPVYARLANADVINRSVAGYFPDNASRHFVLYPSNSVQQTSGRTSVTPLGEGEVLMELVFKLNEAEQQVRAQFSLTKDTGIYSLRDLNRDTRGY